jgi:hypothetical protein
VDEQPRRHTDNNSLCTYKHFARIDNVKRQRQMKHIKKLSPYVIVTVLIYLLVAIVPYDFNIANWGEDTRFSYSLLTTVGLFLVFVITNPDKL